MADIDPVLARFNEIAHHEQIAHMLSIATPPWGIAAAGPDIFPSQRQHISAETAKIVCSSLVRTADTEDVLFAPTLATAVTTAKWQANHGMPISTPPTVTMIDDAAYLAWHYPNPEDASQLHAYMEHTATQRNDRMMHEAFIAAAEAMRSGLDAPVADTMLSYAEASLSLTRRQAAFESVLKVVYGERYLFWRSMPDLV